MPHIFDHTPTMQEVFDEACRYFATTPGPSVTQSGRTTSGYECAYRGQDNRTCIAGHFLPDEAYDPVMDKPFLGMWSGCGTTVQAIASQFPDRVPAWWHDDRLRALLRSLQTVHDEEFNWSSREGDGWNRENIASNLRCYAAQYNLNPAAIDQLGVST